ncbi:hypothetical protein [Labilibaculum antarcticum]|uniref:DUF4837 domain-containing protein n=1 Tax=Labilibaculum antarcticum TaxID=1717717 RepID=A0A1Y1CIK3_9BACT|nr:hypothetical protein [Labilibaculum antarcticum]BAX80219.1 hypothetical protein ALGA_1847 [Labilibaculum antarcticum]
MKTIIVTILICFAGFTLYSQAHLPTASDYTRFYKTKTLVVLEDKLFSDFNDKIKEAVKQNWTLTEYEFISNAEFQKQRFDPKYSFLVTSIVTFNKDKTKAKYNFLSLVLGGQAKQIGDMPDLCSIPLSYVQVDEKNYIYKLTALVQFMQNHIALVSANPQIISENVLRYYNKNNAETKDKTIYVLKNELEYDINSLEKIRNVYPGKVKLVEVEEIENAIKNKDTNVIFLHKVGPENTKNKARCFKILIGAGDAMFYYFDYHMVKGKQTDSFLLSDFRKLAR